MARKIDNPAQSKLRFFVFQDIITCVTGVLVFIVLMMTVNNGSNTRGGGIALTTELASLLDQLKNLNDSNAGMQVRANQLHSLPDAATLKAVLDALKQDLQTQEEKTLVLNQQIRDIDKNGKDQASALGLGEVRDQVAKLNDEIDKLREQNDENARKVADLEQQVKDAQNRLLDQKNSTDKLWVIPEPSETTKEPVLVVLSGRAITLERFSDKTTPVVVTDDNWESAFQQTLNGFDHTKQYMVVFLKPSGISRFKTLLHAIKKAQFEVGYDVLEEASDIHFSHREAKP